MTQELQFFTRDRNEFETLISHLLHLGLYTTDSGFWERASDDQVYMVSVYTGNFRGEFAVYAPHMDFDPGNVASLEDILALNTKEKLWRFIRTLPDTTPDTSAIEPEDEPLTTPTEEPNANREVTIVFQNGEMTNFIGVTDISLNNSTLTFNYPQGDYGNTIMEATFYTDTISGYIIDTL